MTRVLIIESDRAVAQSIKDGLDYEGFETILCVDGSEGLKRALDETFDAILLEEPKGTPAGERLSVLKEIRRVRKDIPILLLADQGKEEDLVYALNSGADDYLVKPVSIMVLVARIRSQLRRQSHIRSTVPSAGHYPGYEPVSIRVGDALVSMDKMVARTPQTEHALTPKELGIIRLLYRNRGKVVSREMMMKEIWGSDVYITERVIDTNVVSIRKKIGDVGRRARFIKTVFGVGYKMIEH